MSDGMKCREPASARQRLGVRQSSGALRPVQKRWRATAVQDAGATLGNTDGSAAVPAALGGQISRKALFAFAVVPHVFRVKPARTPALRTPRSP